LIVYGTCEGQTAKIASNIRALLKAKGSEAVLFNPELDGPLEAENFDSFIVGAPVHASKFPTALVNWVSDHSLLLSHRPSAFFSVCLGVLQTDNPKVVAEENKIVTDFFEHTHWKPSLYEIFAGALKYSKYGWLKKRVMRAIAKKAGQQTSMARDYEYTDWQQVAKFVETFLRQSEKFAAPSPAACPLTSTV
jgi:menaquinone-dependent protoporphyrinogen oxidase